MEFGSAIDFFRRRVVNVFRTPDGRIRSLQRRTRREETPTKADAPGTVAQRQRAVIRRSKPLLQRSTVSFAPRARNSFLQVTGALLFCGSRFAQMQEGPMAWWLPFFAAAETEEWLGIRFVNGIGQTHIHRGRRLTSTCGYYEALFAGSHACGEPVILTVAHGIVAIVFGFCGITFLRGPWGYRGQSKSETAWSLIYGVMMVGIAAVMIAMMMGL